MFLVSLLTGLYGFLCVFLVLMVLLQRGKGSMGLGSMGGGSQALFGSSGGQDVFQKITWVCCTLLLAGSLVLSIMRAKYGTVGAVSRVPARSHQTAQNS